MRSTGRGTGCSEHFSAGEAPGSRDLERITVPSYRSTPVCAVLHVACCVITPLSRTVDSFPPWSGSSASRYGCPGGGPRPRVPAKNGTTVRLGEQDVDVTVPVEPMRWAMNLSHRSSDGCKIRRALRP